MVHQDFKIHQPRPLLVRPDKPEVIAVVINKESHRLSISYDAIGLDKGSLPTSLPKLSERLRIFGHNNSFRVIGTNQPILKQPDWSSPIKHEAMMCYYHTNNYLWACQ